MKIQKVGKLLTNLQDKNEYVILIRNLKYALGHGLLLKKVHTIIKFNQKGWLKPYIDMSTAKKGSKKWIWKKIFFKFNNAVFGLRMENVGNDRYIKLISNEARKII